MMRMLAEFVMRGRLQAVSMALVGTVFPFLAFLTQGALGLVTLRKGWQEGFFVTLWACLPALATLWFGKVGAVMALGGIAVLLVAYLAALVLRLTVSWPATLAVTVAASTLSALLVATLTDNVTAELTVFFRRFLETNAELTTAAEAELFSDWTITRASGVIAYWISLSVLVGVFVARWWQSLLYNPGGFQAEFHGLRLTLPLALASALGLVYCSTQGLDYIFWASVFGLPLLIAGIGLAHCVKAKYKLGTWSLVVLYFGLLFVPPFALALSVIGLTDVWLDYRKRFNLMQRS
ncbi:hypothetical protein [Teredinibacter waterburyi]|jgi:hypothetical protein|uniref:hypothetical protein n=1 Tax=Teredinibacter waterburyi TaxID=1500538 RepID=UPI001FE6ACAC|nr:hypothetical protein [Teredinibacter waterburyi]